MISFGIPIEGAILGDHEIKRKFFFFRCESFQGDFQEFEIED